LRSCLFVFLLYRIFRILSTVFCWLIYSLSKALCKGRGTTEGGGGIVSEPKDQFFLAKFFLLLYNNFRQDLKQCKSWAVMPSSHFLKKGGIAYGKRIHNLFYAHSVTSGNFHKKITPTAKWSVIFIKINTSLA